MSANSYEALVNLSADVLEERLELMLSLKAVDRSMETLLGTEDASKRCINAALMLMANLTTSKEGSRDTLQSQLEDPILVGAKMRRVVEKFLAAEAPPAGEEDAWQHTASVLCNLTQLQDGRDMIRRRSTQILPRLILQLKSTNPVRRRGVASTVRNCCYETTVGAAQSAPPLKMYTPELTRARCIFRTTTGCCLRSGSWGSFCCLWLGQNRSSLRSPTGLNRWCSRR